MTSKARFVTLYIGEDEVEVHIQRIGRRGRQQVGRYQLRRGDPSLDRLWGLLRDRKYTSYPAQIGWGVTPSNGRDRRVYTIKGRDMPLCNDAEYDDALAQAWGLMVAQSGTPEEEELVRVAAKIATYERRYIMSEPEAR